MDWGFQIVRRRLDLDEVDIGYTTFQIEPRADPIKRPFKIDSDLNAGLEKFKLQISSQLSTFECTGERQFQNWFKLDFIGKPAWAWLSVDDELVATHEEELAVKRFRTTRDLLLESGQVCNQTEPEPSGKLLVVSIDDECCASSKLVGAKAASLAQLRRFVAKCDGRPDCCSVPPAFVLTRHAHDAIVAENPDLRAAIDKLRGLVGEGDSAIVRDECTRIRGLIAEGELPNDILEELKRKLEQAFPAGEQEVKFAVRSSSWGEDEADMSAAGQLDTVLNVSRDPEALARAVLTCFASKFSYENIEYKRQHGQPLDLPMAVVVQQMIPCDRAGVMFTCEPTTGDESLVTITANYGLGESVVSGQADPDTVRVRVGVEPSDYSLAGAEGDKAERSLTIEEKSIGKKEVIIGGDNFDRSQCCLSDEQVLALARCGLAIKRYFWSQRCDIEWGFKGGALFLFQSRPVTSVDGWTETEMLHEFDRCLASELNYYSRANVGEILPRALTPMTLTFITALWTIIEFRWLMRTHPKDFFFAPQAAMDFVYDQYHALLSCSKSFLFSFDGENRTNLTKSLEIGIFGREIGHHDGIAEATRGFPKATPIFEGTRFVASTWRNRIMPMRIARGDLALVLDLERKVRNNKMMESGNEGQLMRNLYYQVWNVTRRAIETWDNHLVATILSGDSNLALSKVLSRYIDSPEQLFAVSNKFLAASPDVLSAEIPRRIRAMAELIIAMGVNEASKFVALSSKEALDYLLTDKEKNTDLKRAYQEFMIKFGHRSYCEGELAQLRWHEEPELVAGMIQQNCKALLDIDQTSADEHKSETNDKVLKSLKIEPSLKDRLLIKHRVAPKSQLFLSLREKTKNIIILSISLIRECFQLLAKELIRQQRIPDADLIFYLAYDELEPLVRDHQPMIIMQAVKRRQLFKRVFAQVWKFDEIFSDVIPDHMKPNKELAEIIAQAPKLRGTPASSGRVQGKVCRVEGYEDLDKVRAGSILLTHCTDIAFSPVFPIISGIITEVGGLVSHGAVVAREYGLPSLIGIPDVMRIIQDGEEIILDADNGSIVRLSKAID